MSGGDYHRRRRHPVIAPYANEGDPRGYVPLG
jgi:hypothetical protein